MAQESLVGWAPGKYTRRVVAGSAKVVAGPLLASAATLIDPEMRATGPTSPVDPAVFLARLMTLHGSVDLAQHLDASVPAGTGGMALRLPSSPPERAAVRALVAERALGLRAEVDDLFADPFQRRSRLPTCAEVTAIVKTAALGEASAGDRVAAAERIWAPCGDLVGRTLARVRYELGALREEIGPMVAALGREARLERLDAALFEATAEGRAALDGRMLDAIARSFTRRFTIALTTLPQAMASAHLAPWFARGGILRDALDAGRDLILGVLEHDQRRFAALVAAPSHE